MTIIFTRNRAIQCLLPLLALVFSTILNAEPFAYVSNSDDGTVSVIDTATNLTIGTIPVGGFPIDVVAHPLADRVYVSNSNTDTVAVIDTTTQTVVTDIAIGTYPTALVVHPAGHTLYVADRNNETVYFVDTQTNTVVDSLYLGLLLTIDSMAIHPLGTELYVMGGGAGNGRVEVVNTETLEYSLTEPDRLIGFYTGFLTNIAADPDGDYFFVATLGGYEFDPPGMSYLWIFSTTNNTAVGRIGFDSRIPSQMQADPRGDNLYITMSDNTVDVLNIATLTITDTIAVGEQPDGLAVHPDGRYLYVANSDWYPGVVSPDTVSVVEIATNTVVDEIAVGNSPLGIAINRPPGIGGQVNGMNLERVYCLNQSKGDVTLTTIPQGVDEWNCAARGMFIEPGDSIRTYSRGTAADATTLNVGLEGLNGIVGVCRNNDTSQIVFSPLAGGTAFDCIALGLTVSPGDEVLLIGYGTAAAR